MRYRMATYWVDGTTCAALEHRMYINLRLKNLSTTYPVRYLVFTKFSESAVEQYDSSRSYLNLVGSYLFGMKHKLLATQLSHRNSGRKYSSW